MSVFPDELYPAPRSWAERAYPKLIHYNRCPRADTSPPGSSRSSCPRKCARASSRCAVAGSRGSGLRRGPDTEPGLAARHTSIEENDLNRDRRRFLGDGQPWRPEPRTWACSALRKSTGRAAGVDRYRPCERVAQFPASDAGSLAGKVVLVDFWTYTCINWLRTLPYVRAWAQKYRQELVVIGVHTPEFAFEHNVDNVRRARAADEDRVPGRDRQRLRHLARVRQPILAGALLPRCARTRSPASLRRGRVRTVRAGHSAPAGEAGAPACATVTSSRSMPRGVEAPADWANLRSPENYVGYERTENFASPGGAESDRRRVYAAPARLALNQWALAGDWTMGRQATVLNSPNGRIVYRFHARDLHLVMGPPRRGDPGTFPRVD